MPDPLSLADAAITYGPTGVRCGCGRDAHSNLSPCRAEGTTVSDTRQELYVAAQAFAGSTEAHNLIDNFHAAVLRQAADAMAAQGYEDGFETLSLMARAIENDES